MPLVLRDIEILYEFPDDVKKEINNISDKNMSALFFADEGKLSSKDEEVQDAQFVEED